MSKLERLTAKVFASAAPSDKIGQFGSALTGSKLTTSNVAEIQALPAYTEGWSAAVITSKNYPTLEEMNGVMKVMSYQTAYTLQNGIPEYDINTEYAQGSTCRNIGTRETYISLIDSNIGNPLTDTQSWENITPVSKSGDTMTGQLNIENHNIQIIKTDFDYTSTDIPSQAIELGTFNIVDKNSNPVTGFNTFMSAETGAIRTRIYAQRNVDGSKKQCEIRCDVLPDGRLVTYAPTPASSDNSTQIATTAFVKSVLSSSGNGLATISKASTGSIKFNNGFIVNWGRIQINAGSSATVTFKTPFTSTNYKVVVTIYATDAGSQKNVSVNNYTTTNCKIYNGQGGQCNYDWIAIGY